TTRSRGVETGFPSSATASSAVTSRAGSVTVSPATLTRPARTISSEARREATPAVARYLPSLIASAATIERVDLNLLTSTLEELRQPRYRAEQVWRWAARGAGGFDAMSDLPLTLRQTLSDRVPFSALTVEREAHAADGTVKVLFRTHDAKPVEAVLMRYRD